MKNETTVAQEVLAVDGKEKMVPLMIRMEKCVMKLSHAHTGIERRLRKLEDILFGVQSREVPVAKLDVEKKDVAFIDFIGNVEEECRCAARFVDMLDMVLQRLNGCENENHI